LRARIITTDMIKAQRALVIGGGTAAGTAPDGVEAHGSYGGDRLRYPGAGGVSATESKGGSRPVDP
jgi:hypothetical protein